MMNYKSLIWSEKDIQFVVDNSTTPNDIISGLLLNKSTEQVRLLKIRLGLHKPNNTKYDYVKDFKSITPELAYMFGFIWADGCLLKTRNVLSVNVTLKDGYYIEPIFDKVTCWLKYKRQVKNKQEQLHFAINNKELHIFLEELEFNKKNIGFNEKVINYIHPYEKYFWHGYFDGDGTTRIYKKYLKSSCSANYNFNWDLLTILLKNLECSYSLYKRIRKSGSESAIFLSTKSSLKFLNYIYQDNILIKNKESLLRKYNIYCDYKKLKCI